MPSRPCLCSVSGYAASWTHFPGTGPPHPAVSKATFPTIWLKWDSQRHLSSSQLCLPLGQFIHSAHWNAKAQWVTSPLHNEKSPAILPHHKWESVGAALRAWVGAVFTGPVLSTTGSPNVDSQTAASTYYHNFLVTLVLHWTASSKCGVQYTHMSGIATPSGKDVSVQEDSVKPTIAIAVDCRSASGIICYPTLSTARGRCGLFRIDSWEEKCGVWYWGYLPQTIFHRLKNTFHIISLQRKVTDYAGKLDHFLKAKLSLWYISMCVHSKKTRNYSTIMSTAETSAWTQCPVRGTPLLKRCG